MALIKNDLGPFAKNNSNPRVFASKLTCLLDHFLDILISEDQADTKTIYVILRLNFISFDHTWLLKHGGGQCGHLVTLCRYVSLCKFTTVSGGCFERNELTIAMN